jgi:ribosomal protein S12 methylthiotransferase accessory factor
MEIFVKMAGGRAVEAVVGDHTVRTDQPVKDGGGGSAPSPSDLFLASIAACAGYYIMDFCLERKIPTEGVGVVMSTTKNESTKMLDLIRIEIKLPPEFPEKYEKAVIRAADLCWVKKHIQKAPAFETIVVR